MLKRLLNWIFRIGPEPGAPEMKPLIIKFSGELEFKPWDLEDFCKLTSIEIESIERAKPEEKPESEGEVEA